MNRRKLSLLLGLLVVTAYGKALADFPIPHMEQRGAARQLIVDGKPFLALSGELANTAPSDLEYMRRMMPILAHQVHLNTVLTPVAWAWIEPQEGKFDFSLVDAALENANRCNLRIVWLWFGSWKNGASNFTPTWVKANQDRFPKAQITSGKSVEILSTLSENNCQADARALAALMRHVREVDKSRRVIMVQVENEVGLLGDSRDRSPQANEAFGQPVPKQFLDYLQKHKDGLLPEFRKIWEAAGFKTSGTWEEVFGKGNKTDEIFMGWNYACYVDKVAAAGKGEYDVPMFANAWLVAATDRGPGDYPSGGPQDHMHDIWRAAAPHIDMLCPDVYVPNFSEMAARFSRSGNTLFVPECAGDVHGAANAFYAIGQHNAVGYSTMGVGELQRLTAFRAGAAGPQAPTDVENLPLPLAYATLSQLAPLVLEHQAKGTIAAAWLLPDKPATEIKLGGYTLNVSLGGWGRRTAPDGSGRPGHDSGCRPRVRRDRLRHLHGDRTGRVPHGRRQRAGHVLARHAQRRIRGGAGRAARGPFRGWPVGHHAAPGRRRLDGAERPGQRRGRGPVRLRRAALFPAAPFLCGTSDPAREGLQV